METELHPVRMRIYRVGIAMRKFEHAAAARNKSESIVVSVEWSNGRVGWGQTLPRPYVTGETLETVEADLQELIWPEVRKGQAGDSDRLAELAGGRCINAAVAAWDIAHFDATQSAGGNNARIASRVSGVLGSADPKKTARKLRMMRWFGLRDFKLKLGFSEEVDAENLQVVYQQIGKAVSKGKCSLRVDANGGWDRQQTIVKAQEMQEYGVCVIEQPVFCSASELADLAMECEVPLMADESLLTPADAEALAVAGARVWWNIRISKNGGITRAALLAKRAYDKGIPFVFGCMVGESSILSAAQRRLLQVAPKPRFVEGNYGRFLLADDVTCGKSLRFGYGGRLKGVPGNGLGICVSQDKIDQYGELIAELT